jgi:hypothetical protein
MIVVVMMGIVGIAHCHRPDFVDFMKLIMCHCRVTWNAHWLKNKMECRVTA